MQPRVPRDQSLPLPLGGLSKWWADQGGGSVGPGRVGNERGFGTESSTAAAIASEFELGATYERAWDRQRRDCMYSFLLSATSALPPPLL